MTDPATLVRLYSDRRAVHVYALVDLEEPFWTPSRWYRRGDAAVGIVSLPDGEGVAVYAVSTADPTGTLSLLVDLVAQLPVGQLITGPVGLAEALASHRPLVWSGPHLRYELVDHAPATSVDQADVVALGAADRDDLAALYASEPGAAFFLPHMVDDRTFVGVRDDGRLIAAAGTHVVSGVQRVAAIGAVYTHREHRGRGLGRAVTAGVIRRLAGRVDVVGLNVAEENTAARTVYERLGFRAVWPYEECELGAAGPSA